MSTAPDNDSGHPAHVTLFADTLAETKSPARAIQAWLNVMTRQKFYDSLGRFTAGGEAHYAQLVQVFAPQRWSGFVGVVVVLAAISRLWYSDIVRSRRGLEETVYEKYGFDSTLRTYGDDSGEEGLASPGASLSSVGKESSFWDGGTRGDGEAMRLWRRPVAKQYFHRGLLWRVAEHTEVMSFELFSDLLYVGTIAIDGDHALEGPTGLELLRFVVTFLMNWKIWADVQQIIGWPQTNDILQRVQILFLIVCLLGSTTNMLQMFHGEQDSFTQLVTFYLAARLFGALYCFMVAFWVPLVKGMMTSTAVNVVIGAGLRISSTYFPPHSAGHATLEHRSTEASEPAAATEEARGGGLVAMIPVFLSRYGRSHTTPFAKRFNRFIEHKVSRTNMFITLVLGYSVVAMIFQNTGAFVLNAFLGKPFLGLTQAFIFNWLYFEFGGSNIRTHAIRWRVETASKTLTSSSPSHTSSRPRPCASSPSSLTARTPPSPLSPPSINTAQMITSPSDFVCTTASDLVSPLLHGPHLPQPRAPSSSGDLKTPKMEERLNSLALVFITTALSAWTLFFELYGKPCKT
ncbi:hypothetical protein OQA88_13207 [Cercophora sp. LCS_1]